MSPRHRILYHHRIRAEDGQAVHVRQLIAALRAAGHEVHECALVQKAGKDGDQRSDGRRGVWHWLRLPRFLVECFEILYTRRGQAMIEKAAAEFQPDFIYERHALHCAAGLRAANKLGIPLLLEVNSPMCDEMERLGLLWFKRLARRTEHRVLAGADRVLAVSDVLADRLVALGARADRMRVVRNGADPELGDAAAVADGRALRQSLGLTNGQYVLGFVGYMRDWHRLDLVLEAMAASGGDAQKLHLILAGEGPAMADLLVRAEALGLTDRVHALGAVDHCEVPGVCAAFDVALVPSINDYASPLKMFDSLAAGVLTVALDQPNIRELIADGQTGVTFAPGDVGSLADRLAELLDDPDRGRRIGAAGREALVKNDWTWTGNARRVIEAYGELC